MEDDVNELSCEKTIYVVGYPKSGNTWLVRLLADALNIPVKSKGMRGALEIASGVNATLDPSRQSEMALSKMHGLPNDLIDEIGCLPQRCVYIHRDFRDVVISAYYYFHRKAAEKGDFRYRSLSGLIRRDPLPMPRYLLNRRRFEGFVRSWCDERNAGKLPAQATWKQHVQTWMTFLNEQRELHTHHVSYESLLADPFNNLMAMIDSLQLPVPEESRLHSAIHRQSFGILKQQMESLSEQAAIPFGKDFNVRFLRKGTSGDWLHYLSPKLGKLIQDYNGELLAELGYIRSNDWYQAIEPQAA